MAALQFFTDFTVESPFDRHRPRDGLPIDDLWFPDLGCHPEFLQEPSGDDVEVQLPHAPEDRLGRLFVDLDVERGVLTGEFFQRQREFILIADGARVRVDGTSGEVTVLGS